ncbi:MAG: ABC transporter ATP-binding protein [Pyrinomonadaceae bacterium]
MRAIEARDLTKKFGDFTAVDDIDFEVGKGETFAILGENGAGKSTTMRMIACRSPLTSGEILVENLSVKQHSREIRNFLGVVPQENNLDPDLNVWENLLVYSRYFRIPKEIALERTRNLLDFIRLSKKKDSKVESLSGGMKRRLIIARALLHDPKILLLDEPTTGLDPNVRQEIWEKLEELRTEKDLTILLSTHYMDEAEKLSQNLIFMANGKIIASGNPGQLIRRKVKKFALEIREAFGVSLSQKDPEILFEKRGNTHLYFAENPEKLTQVMNQYGARPMLLRPSNLEDVFLQLLKNKSVEPIN